MASGEDQHKEIYEHAAEDSDVLSKRRRLMEDVAASLESSGQHKSQELPGQLGSGSQELPVQLGTESQELPGQLGTESQELPVQLGTESQELPGQLSTESQELPGQLGTESQELTGHLGTESQELTGHLGTESQELPGHLDTESQELSGHLDTESQEFPGQLGTESQELPGQLGTESQELPGQLGTESQELPGQLGTESQELPVQLGTESQELPGQLGTESQELPGQLGTESQELPGRLGTESQELPGQLGTVPQGNVGQDGSQHDNQAGTIATSVSEVEGTVAAVQIRQSGERSDPWASCVVDMADLMQPGLIPLQPNLDDNIMHFEELLQTSKLNQQLLPPVPQFTGNSSGMASTSLQDDTQGSFKSFHHVEGVVGVDDQQLTSNTAKASTSYDQKNTPESQCSIRAFSSQPSAEENEIRDVLANEKPDNDDGAPDITQRNPVIKKYHEHQNQGEKYDSDEDRIDIGDQGRRKINKTSLSSTTISSTHEGDINININNSRHINFKSIGTTITTAVKRKGKRTAKSTKNPGTPVTALTASTDMRPSGASLTHEDRPHFMLNTVAAWRRENIYITKGVEAVKEKISSKGCVCVIGVPGAGKSTALHHAALSLQTDGFIIYCVYGPDEFLKYYDINKKQVFVLDDALGVYSVDQGKVKLWQEHNENVRLTLGTNTKLLVSIRTQIFRHETIRDKNIVFLNKSVTTDHVDFSDADYKLGIDDMRGMLTHYMTTHGVNVDNINKVIKQVWGYTDKELTEMTEGYRQYVMSEYTAGVEFSQCFPLLCGVYINTDFKQNPRAFFTNPFPALTKVFQNIKTDNKHQFCALVLCTMFDGKLTDDLVSPLSESPLCDDKNKLDKDKEIRNYIMSTYKLKCPDDLEDLQSALNSLTGVYILHVGDRYKISHAVFHDIVTYLYNDPLFVFKYGTREFIRDRVRLNKDEQQHDPYILVYSDDTNIERLADRLFRDCMSDRETGDRYTRWRAARFITENPNIDDDRLISRLRSKLLDRAQTDKTLINDLFIQCMWTVWLNRYTYKHGDVTQYKLIQTCLQVADVNCNQLIYGAEYPLHISVRTGSLQLTQLLLQHGADKRRVVYGHSVLHRLCIHTKYNKVELVKLLVQGDLSVVDWEGRTVTHDNILTYVDMCGRNILYYSVDDYDLTKHLLTYPSLQKHIHECDDDNRTPCWYIINNKKPVWWYTEDIVIKKKQDMIQLYKKHGATL